MVGLLDVLEGMPETDAAAPATHEGQLPLQQLPLLEQFVSKFLLLLDRQLLADCIVVLESGLEVMEFDVV